MSRVFLGNWHGHDVTELERFGDLNFLTKGKVDIWSPSQLAFDMLEEADLKNFDSKNDYYVPSGSVVINFIVGMLLGSRGIDSVKLLIFDAVNQKYVLRDWSLSYLNKEI